MLSEAEVARYRRDGYVIPEYRVPDATLEAIREDHARLLERHPEFEDYCPAVLAFDPGFLEYARSPEILDAVEQLIGGDIALWNSSFFAKPARRGRRTPWHQDGEYWPIRPLATCSVWIAVDASTRKNGCVRVIPGSHKERRLLEHEIDRSPDLSLPLALREGEIDEAEAVDLVLEAGQISLHDIFLVHGSEPNRSELPRRGMTLRYMPTTSVYRRELSAGSRPGRTGRLNMAERTLYLMRGCDRSGENDFRVRF